MPPDLTIPTLRSFRRKHAVLYVILTLLAAALLQRFLSPEQPVSEAVPGTGGAVALAQQGTVVRAVDGDTLLVLVAGAEEKVRLIGLDSPESVDPRKPVECFGKEASARLASLAAGKSVRLETDSTQDERDRYGRLLRYATVEGEPVSLNERQIHDGYAHEYTYEKAYLLQAQFRAAEQEARAAKRGLWADGACVK